MKLRKYTEGVGNYLRRRKAKNNGDPMDVLLRSPVVFCKCRCHLGEKVEWIETPDEWFPRKCKECNCYASRQVN